VLESYLSLLATLPPDNEPLVVKLQSLAPDARFQFTCTALGSQGQLIQASVTENEADVRHLALWQSQGHILALNNYETEWQAQLTALRVIKTPDTRFVIANGTTRQLEDSAPFIKVYQQLEPDFKFVDKTHTYVPNELLEVFGSSEFIGESANLKMDTLLLDPARIMAACDSCGLVSTRALWQWAGNTGYQRVDQQILNDPNNALYSALAVLVRHESAPAWAQSFLTAGTRSALKKLDRFDPNRYPAIEQGLLVADTQSWQQGYQYTITGPILLTVQVQPDPQGHWQVVGILNPRIQKPGWFNHHPLAG